MNNTCPSPGCGAVYNLTPAHVGRSFTCKKCNAQLSVSSSGLELSGPPAYTDPLAGMGSGGGGSSEQRYADDPPPSTRGSRPRTKTGGGGMPAPIAKVIESLTQDTFSWVVGVGLFTMILFLFLPLIDKANVDSKQANLRQKARQNDRDNKDNETKRAEWIKTELPKLQDEISNTQDNRDRSLYWYRWGMMLAFFILSAGGIGYLMQESTVRRIVGGVLVCAQVVVIVIAFVTVSIVAAEENKGPPHKIGGGPIQEVVHPGPGEVQ